MARFTAVVDVDASVAQVWQRFTDWPVQGRFIPLTTVRVLTQSADGVGARFVGRTALGPLGFDDPMEITEWSPPVGGGAGFCRVVKHGRVVLGWAEVLVEPRGTGGTGGTGGVGSTVRWTEDVQVAPVRLTRPFDRLIAAGGRRAFERMLRAMARQLEVEVRSVG